MFLNSVHIYCRPLVKFWKNEAFADIFLKKYLFFLNKNCKKDEKVYYVILDCYFFNELSIASFSQNFHLYCGR